MNTKESILGCFVSSVNGDTNGDLFRKYIWGNIGICDKLNQLYPENYGKDILKILLQFYVNPNPYLLQHLKEVDSYRKNEKSIAVNIVINNENFFVKSEIERYSFLNQIILEKLDSLLKVVKKKKLDTNIQSLINDFKKNV
ncbi:MAG: hypothetical protein O9346_13610 [Leptospiraceae bacterium]|jgi:hypothetical protein|nr:hypothetical protein [Leptospiraceae bacterium]MCZ8347446.1 hypothetical protein [Leptospiraceae bacterium]